MPLTHCSNAASFGLFDLQNNRFTNPTPRQPAVTSAPDIVGIWRDIPVCVAIGDNQASFMGSVSDPHGALVNICLLYTSRCV